MYQTKPLLERMHYTTFGHKAQGGLLARGKKRVGFPRSAAVDGLQPLEGGADLCRDLHMSNKVFACRTVAFGVIGQAGDLSHQQIHIDPDTK